MNAFVSLKEGNETSDQVRKDLISQVRKSIGPFAAPKAVFVVDDLPKTRSGKIMRRILRKILSGEEDSLGDISTVSNGPLQTIRKRTDSECSSLTRAWLRRLSRLFRRRARSERNHRIVAVSYETGLGYSFQRLSLRIYWRFN